MLLFNVISFRPQEKASKLKIVESTLHLMTGFIAPVFLWFTYAYFTFGDLLPNTLAAKSAQGQSGIWPSFPQRLIQEWIPNWGSQFKVAGFPFLNWWWLLIIIGVGFAIVQKRKWLVFIGWIILYITGYTILQVAAYWWYQLPILFILQIFFALGLIKFLDWFTIYISSQKVN